MAAEGASSTDFTSAVSLTNIRMTRIPERYILPPSQRPCANPSPSPSTNPLPLVDLASLHDPSLRSQLVDKIGLDCKEMGLLQVKNHGVSAQVIEGALDSASEFFKLPAEEKMKLFSEDYHKPVRYGTNHVKDKVFFWRDFLKHYSHPLSKWLPLWPSSPSCYREKMGAYAEAVQKLYMEIMVAILESLGLNPGYMKEELQAGIQFMAVNCYPACPEPELALGIPPHTDHGFLTILLQDSQGLEIMDKEGRWIAVPDMEGTLLVQVGDHLQVMSNGRYKSVMHRATVNSEKRRVSIASIHSLGMDQKVSPASELVDEQHPLAYTDTSFSDYLRLLSANKLDGRRYIETLKLVL